MEAASDRMRNYRCLSLATAVILLLVLTAMEAEGIRLDAETRASVSTSSNSPMVNKASVEVVKGSASDKTVAAGEVRVVAHNVPDFHEDYYVAGVHSPRHH